MSSLALSLVLSFMSDSTQVDLEPIVTAMTWFDEKGTRLSLGADPVVHVERFAMVEAEVRLEDGVRHGQALVVRPGISKELWAHFPLELARKARSLSMNVGFTDEGRGRGVFDVGVLSGDTPVLLGRVDSRKDGQLEGMHLDISPFAGESKTFYLRLHGFEDDRTSGLALTELSLLTYRHFEDLLAQAPAARYLTGGERLRFESTGSPWVGFQHFVTMADGIVYDRALALHPAADHARKLEARFPVSLPDEPAVLRGAIGLSKASFGGSSLGLEVSFIPAGSSMPDVLVPRLVLKPSKAPALLDIDFSRFVGRSGHIVLVVTSPDRADRPWPYVTRLALEPLD